MDESEDSFISSEEESFQSFEEISSEYKGSRRREVKSKRKTWR